MDPNTINLLAVLYALGVLIMSQGRPPLAAALWPLQTLQTALQYAAQLDPGLPGIVTAEEVVTAVIALEDQILGPDPVNPPAA